MNVVEINEQPEIGFQEKINEMLQNEFPAGEISSSREPTLLFDVQAIRAIRLLCL